MSVPYPPEARDQWKAERLIVGQIKVCDELMMFTKHEQFTTSDPLKVTCKHCLKKIVKFDDWQ